MRKSRWGLVTASTLYLFSASTGARIAIDEDIPAAFLGRPSRKTPQEDFVRGTGTALSPGVPMLMAQVLLTALAPWRGKVGLAGAGGLMLMGMAATIGTLGEPITYRVLHPKSFDPPRAIVVLSNILLPVLMMAFGAMTFSAHKHTD